MKQRNGRLITKVVPSLKMPVFEQMVTENIVKGSTISTDEFKSYNLLQISPYKHGSVNHGAKEYARGIHHTNHLESFWKLFKDSVRSTHIHISKKYAQKYLDEFTFRSNFRHRENAMFDLLIAAL
jgi:transposase